MFENKRFTIIIFVLILTLSFVIFYFQKFQQGASFLFGVAINKNIELKKENHLNILFLGVPGGKHDGANLSDTIIFAMLDPEKNEINLISIPRDLWAPVLEAKINTAYSFGKLKNKQGIPLVESTIKNFLGENVDYTLVVNFSAFEEIVDILGGLDVDVKNTFDDYEFPIEGKENDLCDHKEEEIPFLATAAASLEAFPCRYEHIHFDQGVVHMDGKTALAYVRSRHAQGAEGTDFARSARQHQGILAMKSKVLSLGTIFNPMKVLGIYNIIKDNIDTNISTDEIDDFIKLAQKMKTAKINNYVLDMGDSKQDRYGLLVNPERFDDYKNQWVLIPRTGNGNFSEIQEYVSCIKSGKICEITKTGILIQEKH